MTRGTPYTLLAIAAVALALAGCGGDDAATGGAVASVADGSTAAAGDTASTTDTSDSAASREDSMLAFARCMRENGVDVPDPKPGEPMRIGDKGTNRATMDKAQKACQKHLRGAGKQPSAAELAEFKEAGLKFARCMRKNGVDLPDPEVDGGGIRIGGTGLDPSDPTFKKAQKACEGIMRNLKPGGAKAGGAKAP
jgi:hypothetical protein